MSQYSGNIRDLPVVTGGHFIENSTKKIVFGPDGRFWDDYVMRHFILPAHSGIPAHEHEWDHLMFTLSGDGVVEVEEEPGKRVPYLMKTGYWTRVPGGLLHEYKNDSDVPLEFFCIVPTRGDPHAKKFSMRAERAKRKEEAE